MTSVGARNRRKATVKIREKKSKIKYFSFEKRPLKTLLKFAIRKSAIHGLILYFLNGFL